MEPNEYLKPKDLVKNKIRHLMQVAQSDDEKKKAVEWVLEFARQLQESFEVVLKLLKARDSMDEVADLYVLDRMANFYPLLMKTYSRSAQGEGQFRKVARLMEIFAFRGYGIANLRSDTGKKDLYILARDFEGDFGGLEAELRRFSGAAPWNVEQRFLSGLGDPLFYNQSGDARYLLWKYENWLRSQPGNHYSKISWREYIGRGSKDKLSIEHIAAPKGDLPDGDYALAEKEGNDDMFRRKLLHSLGNLVLDCHSPNASKGKNPFPDKETHYAAAPLISQNELREKFVKSVKPDGKPIWDEIAINARAERLINFAKEFWDPGKN